MTQHVREALTRLSDETTPSLILLDWHMPDMNGKQFLARREEDARLAVILAN